jgi:hypothetical protein
VKRKVCMLGKGATAARRMNGDIRDLRRLPAASREQVRQAVVRAPAQAPLLTMAMRRTTTAQRRPEMGATRWTRSHSSLAAAAGPVPARALGLGLS